MQSIIDENYQIKHNLVPLIIDSIFNRRNVTLNLQHIYDFTTEKKKLFLALEILHYQVSQLWVLLPCKSREINTIIHFKN